MAGDNFSPEEISPYINEIRNLKTDMIHIINFRQTHKLIPVGFKQCDSTL